MEPMEPMEPIETEVTIEDVTYAVTITYIGEVQDLPDGSGNLPIEYYCQPECPEQHEDMIVEYLNSFVTLAIQEMIKSHKEK